MKLLAPAIGALAMAALTASQAGAQNYPWCANFADGAGVNCGFPTYEQCMATSVGSGGYCTPNNLYKPAAAATSSGRHQSHKHHSGRDS
jgi:uncharacterized protein DUF3551